jgi:predicted nucleic acid-binding protein
MSDSIAFLDTNVLLRHLLQDHLDHSPRATALVDEIERGKRSVQVADTVIFEATYTLEKTYRVSRSDIGETLQRFLDMPGVVLSGKTIFAGVFAIYVRNPGLSIADCYHIELAKRLTNGRILSFDRRFGTVEGVIRQEPKRRPGLTS